jgi:N-acyl homoserine lactone hydrolase
VLLTSAERAYTDQQLAKPDIVAASNIRAVQSRMRTIEFQSRAFMGFDTNADLFGDGSIVVVALPGHTPGSVGVFVTLGSRRVFHVGDAAYLLEAVERGLPKSPTLRAFADHNGPAADAVVQRLAAFRQTYPDVAIVPAHDRQAWEAAFGPQPGCKKLSDLATTEALRSVMQDFSAWIDLVGDRQLAYTR